MAGWRTSAYVPGSGSVSFRRNEEFENSRKNGDERLRAFLMKAVKFMAPFRRHYVLGLRVRVESNRGLQARIHEHTRTRTRTRRNKSGQRAWHSMDQERRSVSTG